MTSNIIILNGPSSAGKSSITKELQFQLDSIYLHLPLDSFLAMVPDHIEEKAPLYEKTIPTLIDSAVSLVKNQNNVIADVVLFPENMTLFVDKLKNFSSHFIAITASLKTLQHREKTRGDREIGLAESQYQDIHKDIAYDFKIDTTELTAKESAQKIIESLDLETRPI